MRRYRTIILNTGFLLASLFALNTQAEPLLNGLAIHTELGKEQFIAGLFSNTLSESSKTILLANSEKRIQVRVLARRLSARSFKRLWIEGIAINASPNELKLQSQNMANFSNMLKAKMIAGDIFTIDRSLDDVTISLNGTKLGVINDTSFFDILLRTWIGPVPLSSDFRSALLTNGNIDSGLQSRFNETRPSDKRIDAVAAAIAGLKQKTAQESKETSSTESQVAVETPAVNLPPAPDVASVPAPKIEVATPKATPEVKKAKPKPTPEPEQQVALIEPDEELFDESILEEEEEDIEFTAAGMLVQSLYISKLKRWTNKHIKYPSRALDRGWEGNVRLNITINRNGEVQDVVAVEEAPYKDLTKAALKAVKKANPFPAVPDEVSGDSFKFTLPIVFVLQ